MSAAAPSLVYVDSSVVSYATARLARDEKLANHQRASINWLNRVSGLASIQPVVSRAVLAEIQQGDAEVAQRRLSVTSGMRVLAPTPRIFELAKRLVEEGYFPIRSGIDAVHLAYACEYQAEFLVTWNFKHLANPAMFAKLRGAAEKWGQRLPMVCSPIRHEEVTGLWNQTNS